jgi:esterase/lipase superfamily enzyme
MSTRARVEGRDRRTVADSLEYGIAVHGYRRQADVLTGALGMVLVDTVQLSREAFVHGVREASVPDSGRGDFAVLYVHGYGTSLHECWQHASESRIRSRSGTPWVAFCWPSRGSGVAAPSRGAILDGGYVADSAAAWASRPAFVRAAGTVLDALPPPRVLFVGHSLGAALLGSALRDSTALRSRLLAEPARAIAFVSADIAANYFIDSVVPAVQPLASRVVAYLSARDRMLALSRKRSGMARAGQRLRGPLIRGELEIIDATDGLVAENAFQRVFGTHHALRRASAVLFDLIQVIGAGRTKECRLQSGTAVQGADGIWALTGIRPDDSAALERCAATDR